MQQFWLIIVCSLIKYWYIYKTVPETLYFPVFCSLTDRSSAFFVNSFAFFLPFRSRLTLIKRSSRAQSAFTMHAAFIQRLVTLHKKSQEIVSDKKMYNIFFVVNLRVAVFEGLIVLLKFIKWFFKWLKLVRGILYYPVLTYTFLISQTIV